MPNLTALLDERDAWQWITCADGHIYALPEFEFGYSQCNIYWLNQRWMDNLGLSEPKSLDELFDILKAFKEKDANGNGDPDDEYPSVVDGELIFIPTSDTWKELLSFARKLYENDLINENCFTLSGTEAAAIAQAGDVAGSFMWKGAFQGVGRDNDDDYIALTPFGEGTYSNSTGVKQGGLAITDACEDPVTFLTMWDRFYSEEGGILAFMGVEGTSYTVDSDGNWNWILDGDYGASVTELRAQASLQGSATVPSRYPDFWYNNMSEKADPDEVYLNQERAKTSSYGVVVLPAMNYTEKEEDRRATLAHDIHSYMNQYMAQVVIGELDLEKSWDA